LPPRLHRRGLVAVHQRRAGPGSPAGSLVEQHLVPALLVRRHQLYAALELRAVRGGGLVHRRLYHHHLSPSRPDLSDPAARFLAGVSCRSLGLESPLTAATDFSFEVTLAGEDLRRLSRPRAKLQS